MPRKRARPGARAKAQDWQSLGNCPCGQRIYASTEACAVMHAIPYCKKFIELGPDAFLKYVRMSRGIITDN